MYEYTLYKLKKTEKELELYKNIYKSFKALRSFQKEHNE